MAKFDKQPFREKVIFFFITPLHAHTQYSCIVHVFAKYQKASVKALVQVDFPMYALSKHKQNMQIGKMAIIKFTKLSFFFK